MDQRIDRTGGARVRCDADAAAHRAPVRSGHPAHLVAHAPGHRQRREAVGLGHQHGELVTPEARDEVVGADRPAHHMAELRKHGVPLAVTEGVVDRLEVVHVQVEQRQRLAVAATALDLGDGSLLEGACVEAPVR